MAGSIRAGRQAWQILPWQSGLTRIEVWMRLGSATVRGEAVGGARWGVAVGRRERDDRDPAMARAGGGRDHGRRKRAVVATSGGGRCTPDHKGVRIYDISL
ncbi:unnamed protein product [Urochloa humidicola]